MRIGITVMAKVGTLRNFCVANETTAATASVAAGRLDDMRAKCDGARAGLAA